MAKLIAKTIPMVALIGCLCFGVGANQAQDNTHLRIGYTFSRYENDQLYIMNSDGSHQMALTSEYGRFNLQCAYSSVVNRLVFISQVDMNFSPEISTMSLDSEHPKFNVLTDDGAIKSGVDWSPSGDRITFGADSRDGSDIYTMNSDGSGLLRLTTNPAVDTAPRWSPDGEHVVFESNRDKNSNDTFQQSEIYVMNANGSNQTRLTFNNVDNVDDTSPAWSPDSKKVVFSSQSNGNSYNIFIMNADGSNVVQLTHDRLDNFEPAWSPDGTQIAYTSVRNDQADIYLMNAAGSNVRQLTNDPEDDGSPCWINQP